MERRRLFHVFLRQFLVVYKNWEPVSQGQFSEAASTPIQPQEFISCSDNLVVGCSAGHPAEVISTLTQEIATLTSLITECKLYLYVLNIRLYQIYFEETLFKQILFTELDYRKNFFFLGTCFWSFMQF